MQTDAVLLHRSLLPDNACPVRIGTVCMQAGTPDSILGRLFSFGGSGLDPVNQMPQEPNQAPAPGQRRPLPTARQLSSIPKGGTETAWLYPSPQMFYNGAPSRPSLFSGSDEPPGV